MMIDYWHQPVVRLSVRLSVCALCNRTVRTVAVTLVVGVYRAKSCTSVFLAGFLFVPSGFRHFSVVCIV